MEEGRFLGHGRVLRPRAAGRVRRRRRLHRRHRRDAARRTQGPGPDGQAEGGRHAAHESGQAAAARRGRRRAGTDPPRRPGRRGSRPTTTRTSPRAPPTTPRRGCSALVPMPPVDGVDRGGAGDLNETVNVLAADFKASNYDIKRLVRTIVNSRAYPVASGDATAAGTTRRRRRPTSKRAGSPGFRVRPLSVISLYASVVRATGYKGDPPPDPPTPPDPNMPSPALAPADDPPPDDTSDRQVDGQGERAQIGAARLLGFDEWRLRSILGCAGGGQDPAQGRRPPPHGRRRRGEPTFLRHAVAPAVPKDEANADGRRCSSGTAKGRNFPGRRPLGDLQLGEFNSNPPRRPMLLPAIIREDDAKLLSAGRLACWARSAWPCRRRCSRFLAADGLARQRKRVHPLSGSTAAPCHLDTFDPKPGRPRRLPRTPVTAHRHGRRRRPPQRLLPEARPGGEKLRPSPLHHVGKEKRTTTGPTSPSTPGNLRSEIGVDYLPPRRRRGEDVVGGEGRPAQLRLDQRRPQRRRRLFRSRILATRHRRPVQPDRQRRPARRRGRRPAEAAAPGARRPSTRELRRPDRPDLGARRRPRAASTAKALRLRTSPAPEGALDPQAAEKPETIDAHGAGLDAAAFPKSRPMARWLIENGYKPGSRRRWTHWDTQQRQLQHLRAGLAQVLDPTLSPIPAAATRRAAACCRKRWCRAWASSADAEDQRPERPRPPAGGVLGVKLAGGGVKGGQEVDATRREGRGR